MKPSDALVQMIAAPITPGDWQQVRWPWRARRKRGAAAATALSRCSAACRQSAHHCLPPRCRHRCLVTCHPPTRALQITGLEGKAPSLPRAGGNEGVGVVLEAGAGSKLAKGDFVVASAPGVGTWASHVIADGGAWTKVAGGAPGASPAFPPEAAAVAVAAPLSAKALLASVPLAAGDVVVQNNAASAVGQAVIQYAAAAGLRTVNIVPKGSVADWGTAVAHLQGLGGTIVVDEAYARTPAFGKLLADLPRESPRAVLAPAEALLHRGEWAVCRPGGCASQPSMG
jgi:NADPH:quinone reductase-like Zn-dependent oxidoreductase